MRIHLKVKRQTTVAHETIASYSHFLVVLLYMRFWSRELQTPIFVDTLVFYWAEVVEIRQCLVRTVSWEDELVSDGPICVYSSANSAFL